MMHRITPVLAAGLLLAATACHGSRPEGPTPSSSPLEGTWRLVQATYTQPSGAVTTMDSTQLRHLKVIQGNHFAYITQASDGRFVRAAAGTCSFDATTYTEHIELTSSDQMRGQSFTFGYRMDGDTWYQNGAVGGTKIEEVYRKVR